MRLVSFLFLVESDVGLLASDVDSSLLDTGLLASECTQIVKLCATYLTMLVDLDALDVRRLDWEDTLNTYGTRHLTHCEALLVSMTGNLDNYTTVELDTLLATLDNFVSDSDSVT